MNELSVSIRSEEPADRAAIHEVHAASFPTPAEARLVDALRAAGRLRVSLVAEVAHQVVGHVAFSPVSVFGASGTSGASDTTDTSDTTGTSGTSDASGTTGALGLAPVAVLPAYRRRGIADRLIRAGLTACGRARVPFVVVLGDPAYYRRFGFEPAAAWGLRDEYGGGEAFQAVELQPQAIPAGTHVVRYAPEFALVAADEGESGPA